MEENSLEVGRVSARLTSGAFGPSGATLVVGLSMSITST